MTQTQNATVTETSASAAQKTGKRRGRPTREEAANEQQRGEQSDFLTGCTVEERAYCVRLIRVLRCNDYWIPALLRQILDRDSASKLRWSIKKVTALLNNFDVIETLASNAGKLAGKAEWSDHPVLRAVRKVWMDDEISEYVDERRIRHLIKSANPSNK